MKKAPKHKKRKQNKYRVATFLSLVVLFGIVMVVLPTTQTKKNSLGDTIPFTPVPAKSNLQLETFTLPSPTPQQFSSQQATIIPTTVFSVPTSSPTNAANNPNPATCAGYVNSGVPLPSNCQCPDIYIICPYTTSDPTDVTVGPNGCLDPLFVGDPPQTGKFCIDKPVIYLYPTTPTLINVKVQTTGSVVVSNPHYPIQGWRDVLAQPNGSLKYQGKFYSELFYETSVTTFDKPTVGITIPTDQLSERLNELLDKLGLVGNEKKEFLAYWIPRLEALHSPYIFFSVLSPSSKATIDAVDISPKPDTMIDFIAYFKATKTLTTDSSLVLPSAPQRNGFVAVEWGGVIDK